MTKHTKRTLTNFINDLVDLGWSTGAARRYFRSVLESSRSTLAVNLLLRRQPSPSILAVDPRRRPSPSTVAVDLAVDPRPTPSPNAIAIRAIDPHHRP